MSESGTPFLFTLLTAAVGIARQPDHGAVLSPYPLSGPRGKPVKNRERHFVESLASGAPLLNRERAVPSSAAFDSAHEENMPLSCQRDNRARCQLPNLIANSKARMRFSFRLAQAPF